MTNLVLEGGGVKGVAYAGVFHAFNAYDKLESIDKVLGVSAGSIAALFLAIGMTPQEMEQALKAIDYNEFQDDSFGAFRDLYRLTTKYGKNKGDFFTHWIEDFLEAYTGSRACTFSELKNLDTSKDLYVGATCLDTGVQEVFSYETYPDMPITIAVRASMAIPFFFTPVTYKGKMYVDGGVLNNYPIHFFDGVGTTIGVRLDTTEEITGTKEYRRDNVLQYSMSLFNIIYDGLQNNHISKKDWNKTIVVDCGRMSAMDFDINKVEIDRLIQAGWISTMEFLKK